MSKKLKPYEARDILIRIVTRGFNVEQATFLKNAVIAFYDSKPKEFFDRRTNKRSIRKLTDKFLEWAEINQPLPKEIFPDE